MEARCRLCDDLPACRLEAVWQTEPRSTWTGVAMPDALYTICRLVTWEVLRVTSGRTPAGWRNYRASVWARRDRGIQ